MPSRYTYDDLADPGFGFDPGREDLVRSTNDSRTTNTTRSANPLNDLERLSAEQEGIEDRLRGELGGIQDTADQVGVEIAADRAKVQAGRASASDAAQFERSTRTLDLSDRQKQAATSKMSLSRALNRASASGATRRGFTDRAKAAESTGSSFADALFGQRVDATTAKASAYASEKGADLMDRANRKANTIGTVGTIIGGALAFFSSEELKHDHGHEPRLLNKLKKVRVNRWQYKGDNKTHVGPFSEEFNREFGIDTDRPDMINVIDALGVTMGAIKELDQKVEARG